MYLDAASVRVTHIQAIGGDFRSLRLIYNRVGSVFRVLVVLCQVVEALSSEYLDFE